MKTTTPRIALLTPALLLVLTAPACAVSEGDVVRPKVDVEMIGKSMSALTASSITALNGTYGASCDGRTGSWSVGANSNETIEHDPLTVQKNDGDCVLTLTEIVVGAAVFAPDSSVALATDWAAAARSWKDVPEDPIDFYGNAKISTSSFSTDFTITVRVSANHNDAASGTKTGTFATQSATVTTESLAAPDYTISMAGFSFQTDNDDIVQSTSGSASLTEGTVTGQDYAVHHGQLSASSTPEAVASAFSSALVKEQAMASSIPHGQFGLDTDDDLTSGPAYRTIIIRNSEGSTGLVSYQLIQVAFYKPAL